MHLYKTQLVTCILILTGFFGWSQNEKPSFTEVEKIGPAINSEYEENGSVYDPITQRLYFIRSFHPENDGGELGGQDIWYSTQENGNWSVPVNFKELNNKVNNAVIGVSTNGDTVYLLGTYERKLQLQKGLSFIPLVNAGSRPTQIAIPGMNIDGDFYSLYMHPSGNYLVISMKNGKSLGEEDLFISEKVGTEWTAPIHLGPLVNSTGYETSPFLNEDATRLYFASNGHEGLGDADIFYADRLDSSWTNWGQPVNLGNKINSAGFDGFPFQHKDRFFFSSNRGEGFSDIYLAKDNNFFQPGDTLHIALMNNQAMATDYLVQLYGPNNELVATLRPDENGRVHAAELRETWNYTLKIDNQGIFNLENFEAFVFNRKGEKVMHLPKAVDGSYQVQGQPKGTVASLLPIQEAKHSVDEIVTGVFEFNQLPVQNVLIALVDENDNELFYTVTNEKGEFKFADVPPGMQLSIVPKTDLSYVAENGSIFITDPGTGKKLLKAASGEGGFTFKRLDTETLAKVSMLTDAEDTKLGAGVFRFRDLPKEGVRLVLMDENDNIIEEVITGPDGSFQFKKLRPDQPFLVKIASEDATLNLEGEVLFLTKDGKTMPLLAKTEDGKSFAYKPLESDFMRSLVLEDESDLSGTLAQEFFLSVGIFKYKELPMQGVKIQLLDENENVIEIVTTDKDGFFHFSKLRAEEKYFIKLADEGHDLYTNSTMYFVGKDGDITPTVLTQEKSAYMFQFNELKADYFFSLKELNEGGTTLALNANFQDIYGVFKYKSLPKTGTKLYLVDENDMVIDSVYTDEMGRFKFRKLNRQDNFTIRLAEGEDTQLGDYSIALEGEEGDSIESSLEEDQFEFNFKSLPKNLLAGLDAENASDTEMDAGKFLKKEEPRQKEEAKLKNRPLPGEATIYFRFNSIQLSNTDRVTLNREIISKVEKGSGAIKVVGYACDLGDEEVNKSVSLLRASQVKKYLVNMGLNPDKIQVEAYGEVINKDDAPSPETRRFNRKVEVYLEGDLTVL